MFTWQGPKAEYTLVNGLSGDPCLYTFFVQSGEAVLFDLGTIANLTNKQLLKVRTVCVSHTHIDHFIGFDRLLRVHIPHFQELEFCGPVGLADNICGKLHGYHWNLLQPGQLRFRVHEISREGVVSSFMISNDNRFTKEHVASPKPLASIASRPLPDAPACFVTNLSDTSRIEAVVLDHGIDSVGYLCQAPLRFVVKPDELKRLRLEPGPWIKKLQYAIAETNYTEVIDVDGKTFNAGDLATEILTYSAPKMIGYVTDIVYSQHNLDRLQTLMTDVEMLVCEANFRDAEEHEATKKKHLTTKQVAQISKLVRAEKTQIFHISKIYKGDEQGHLNEFHGFLV